MPHDRHAAYHADRARGEAVRAISAASADAAAIHQELCLRYSGRVIAALILGAAGKGMD
ncbi:hypothetical protein FHS97_001099 [Sphingomonas endophytica]|uniref:Uncharacterized protein n=1 Tax=Sphingomonas endophytica TaxID=869719 RepID=A0ABR6N323_9SPHN|nr:hypothetical protein [Sphingomonas endophytica]MBB5725183.1 hypothetical protein [Sphingomonas endophytica]